MATTEDTMSYKEYENTVSQKIFEYFITATHVFIIGFFLFILFLCLTNELAFFTWHPVLLTSGWILLMTEGILMLAPNNPLTKGLSLSHKVKVQYHWIIQAIGVSFSVIGYIIVFINKDLHNKPHLHTWHGLSGLISIICCVPACLSGIVALYCISCKSYIKPLNSKLIHRICGILTFIIGMTTVLLSLYSNWFERRVYEALIIVWFIIMLTTAIWSISQATLKVYKTLKTVL